MRKDPPERTGRREELAARLDEVRGRIARAARDAHRDPESIELVVVTKYFPASDVDLLAGLGVHSIGENKDQEAQAKVSELTSRDTISAHFVGQIQSNKAARIAAYADVVQSVDRLKIIGVLDRGAAAQGRTLEVLIQVCLDDTPGRGGAAPNEVATLADAIAQTTQLTLRGVMTVAPLGAPARPAFARLAQISEKLRQDHPGARWISAGMSGDLEDAIAEGATHLRVGSAILGSRPQHG